MTSYKLIIVIFEFCKRSETDGTKEMASKYSNQQQSSVDSDQAVDRDRHLHDICKNESTSSNDSDDESHSNEFWFVNFILICKS